MLSILYVDPIPWSLFFTLIPVHGLVAKYAGLVAQSVLSATDTLGHRDVRGLSAIDPRGRQWISVRTMPRDVGMPL